MSQQHDIPALVLTLSVNGLGVARVLGRRGVRVIGLSDGSTLPGVNSRYVKEIWHYKGGDEGLVTELIHRELVSNAPVQCYSPSRTERSWQSPIALIKIQPYYRVGMPGPDIVRSSMSKFGFATLAEKLQFPVPRSVCLSHPSQIDEVAAQLSFPCIVKPEFRSAEFAKAARQKAFRVDDAAELNKAYMSFAHAALEQSSKSGLLVRTATCIFAYSITISSRSR